MKARFEVRSIKSQWKPPFKKEITDEVFNVEEGESFDRIIGNGNDEMVYTVLSAGVGNATIQYSRKFTLKTGNPGSYKVSIAKDTPLEMTYLWGEDGITKKVTYKGISPGTEADREEEEVEEQAVAENDSEETQN